MNTNPENYYVTATLGFDVVAASEEEAHEMVQALVLPLEAKGARIEEIRTE